MEMKEIREICREFLEFSVNFHQIFKSKFEKTCGIKANSLAFHALMMLQSLNEQSLTMSALAEKLDITKQQLTKLINELEGRSLVARSHDRKNRRLVHVEITQTGRDFLQEHVGRISAELARRLAVLSEKDQQRLTASIETLDEIMDMMLYSHTVG